LNLRVPQQLLAQINSKVANEQAALAALANVAIVASHWKRRRSPRSKQGESRAGPEGDALRANREFPRKRAIEKWNGQPPTYMGGGGQLPLLAVPANSGASGAQRPRAAVNSRRRWTS